MNAAITEAPTGTTMILRALARFPERTAFAWDGGSLTYRATLDLIGRLQAAMAAAGLAKGQTVAFLSANSAETWCAGVAASGLGLITTWLHPLGALADRGEIDARRGGGSLDLRAEPPWLPGRRIVCLRQRVTAPRRVPRSPRWQPPATRSVRPWRRVRAMKP